MRKFITALIIMIIAVFLLTGCTGPSRGVKRADIATSYVNAIFNDDYKELTKFKLTFQMRTSLITRSAYKKVKGVFTDACGDFIEIVDFTEAEYSPYRIVSVVSEFTDTFANVNVVFDKQNRIAGIHYVYNRSYEDMEGKETEVSFGNELPLDGSLAIPESNELVPAVIIVHGSGPSDRNGAVAGNAPYLEIAQQLYEKGIASLRFDKRTYTYAYLGEEGEFDNMTVWEETINDVKMAFDFLAGQEGVDKDQIFIIGHSLGGYLMPRIAETVPQAAGYIMLAPSSSHLEDLIIRQTEYMLNLDGKLSSGEKDILIEYELTADKIRNLQPESGYTTADLLGAPESYWLDLKDYNPVEMMSAVEKPVLIIQGGRDYQVDMIEYQAWLDGLEGKENVRFELFMDLNHMLAAGAGDSTPEEYQDFANVDIRVGDTIADFITIME